MEDIEGEGEGEFLGGVVEREGLEAERTAWANMGELTAIGSSGANGCVANVSNC